MSQTPTGAPRRSRTALYIGIGVALSAAWTAALFMTTDLFTPMDSARPLLADPQAAWSTAPFAAPPLVVADDLWLAVPARTPDGAVFGLVRDADGRAYVRLDEATGRSVWRTPAGPLFASAERSDGWRFGETFPAAPQTLAGPDRYLVVWQREWALVTRSDGAVFKSGAFPEQVPPAAPTGGVCLVGADFWIAIDDGRDGGVMLSAAGELATVRSERPATCPRTSAMPFEEGARSSAQNARASDQPVPDFCAETRRGRVVHANAYCTDLRSDGPPERAVMLRHSDLALRSGDGWQLVTPPRAPDFSAFIFGHELAWPRVFLDLAATRRTTVTNQPAPTSFEPKRTDSVQVAVELVAAVGRAGELLWIHSVYDGPYSESSQIHGNFRSQVAQHRSVLLASHPDSPTQNLYIFKPGQLLAVDQTTGASRFQIGAALPLPK